MTKAERKDEISKTITYGDGSKITITLYWSGTLGRYVTVPGSESVTEVENNS